MSKSIWIALFGMWAAVMTSVVGADGHTPEDALRQMKVPDSFEVQLVASEPLVRQPVCIEFDDRGRLWVIQYLQYPNPAGLKRVQVDRYSRTKYDQIPAPPPLGPRGADRITILTDSDGDGRMDQGRDFIEGLNLATGLAFGQGGVFVLNVPYLLFYPDRNRDDIPDSDPEILLTGFGMEDAHSVANSLTWGPDGWLYGCQGSTVTANIRGIEFQQGVWRYHPVTHEFELFCEGGGNSWGLDFDRTGELLYSTNYGGHVLLHGVQGSYLIKAFAKHGPLHNSHAYGFFDHAPHQNFRGGHVTVGGIVYQGDSFPDTFRGQYLAGDLLGHGVYWHDILPRGSTFQTAHGGELLTTNDTWFAPTDVTMGPDGSVYVSDWHDPRTAHPDPDAEWDRSNGRIYRIAAKGTLPTPPIDFATITTDELLKFLRHRSQWFVRHARKELSYRLQRDTELVGWPARETGEQETILPPLREMLSDADEITSLEGLWGLNGIGAFDEALATSLLQSPHAAVRGWTVRLLGDAPQISPEMAHRLDKFAEREPAVHVRRQLASTAARLPAAQALPIINANINRDLDHDDPYIPLLWWWAVERHSISGRDQVMRRFIRPSLWKSRLGREVLLTRLIRRYAAEGTLAGLDSVVQLLKSAPGDAARDTLWQPILLGLREVPRSEPVASWSKQLADHELGGIVRDSAHRNPPDLNRLQLGLTLGNREFYDDVVRQVMDSQREPGRRVVLLGILADVVDESTVPSLLALIASDAPESVRSAALRLLGRFDQVAIAQEFLALHQATQSDSWKSQLREGLLSRKSFAQVLLSSVDQGEIPATAIPLEQIQRVASLESPELDRLVRKHWGQLGATKGEKLAEVRRLNNDLRAAQGSFTAGEAVFKKNCASCHQLFGEGTKLGPDLTTANRKDRDFMLVSLVDPSNVIRKEYSSFIVQTKDGRVLSGMAIARDDAGVTLVNAKNEKTTILASEIDELQESRLSLMPEDLYKQLKPQELRDLFAYLESAGKPPF
jgi:putative membrane-bound dehydrogenase-like protein